MWRKLDAGAAAVLLMVLAVHLLLRNAVKKYYATHLPHYDSIGSYTFAYGVLNTYADHGWWAAVKHASGFGLSLTQPMFAAVFSPFLSPTPQSLVLYNSLCLGLLCWSLYALCRALGAGPFKGIVAAALPLVPDAFYWWNGGLQDWQRDPSYFCLLGSSFFLFFRHLILRTTASGVMLGIAIALTTISRDTAPGYVLMIMGPLFTVWCFLLARSGGFVAIWQALAVPAVIVAGSAAIYATFMLEHTLVRFGNAYVVYAFGGEFSTSLKAQWKAPFQLIFGVSDGFGATARMNLSVVAMLGCLGLFLASAGIWRIHLPTLQRIEVKAVVVGSLWAFVVTMVHLLAGVGIGALPFSAVKPTLYPTLLLFLSAGLALIVSMHGKPSRAAATAVTLIFCGALVLAIPSRIAAKSLDDDPAHLVALPVFLKLINDQTSPTFAFFWHDGISVDTLIYHAAQRHHSSPRKLAFLSSDGYGIDTAIGVPKGANVRQMQEQFLSTTLCRADYVVLSPRLSLYERDAHHMFIFRHGRPFIERLTKLLESNMVYQYTWFGIPLNIYDNTRRQHCAR